MNKERKAPTLGSRGDDTAKSQPLPAVVKARDAFGREVEVPREEWRTRILPGQIQRHWRAPDALAQVIVSACDDGFPYEVLDASEQLVRIDPSTERSHIVRAIVHSGCGRYGTAQETLEQAIGEVGRTAPLLYRLARVMAARHRTDGALETLERALEADPNHSDAILWWVELQSQKKGIPPDVTYAKLAEMPGSWRPSLWLAARELERKENASALLRFESALRLAGGSGLVDALSTISAALNQHELYQEAIDLVRPRYDVQNADAQIGVNLAESYLRAGKATEGLALLDKLYALGIPALASALRPYSEQLEQLRDREQPAQEAARTPDNAEISMGVFDRPLWLYGACDVSRWVQPQPIERKTRVAVVVLTASLPPKTDERSSALSDTAYNCCRAFALFLAEGLYCGTSVDVNLIAPLVHESESILFGAEETDEQLRHMAETFGLIVTGTIGEIQGSIHARVRVRRSPDLAEVGMLEESFGADQSGLAATRLRDRLVQLVARETAAEKGPQFSWYSDPPVEHATGYLSALNQFFALILLRGPEHYPRLRGERAILHFLQSVSMTLSEHEPSQFMFFSALAKARRLGSRIVGEFERAAVARMNELTRKDRYSARLAPLVHAVFGLRDDFEWSATGNFAFDAGYAEWCDALVTDLLEPAEASKRSADKK